MGNTGIHSIFRAGNASYCNYQSDYVGETEMTNPEPFEYGRKSCNNGIPFTANPYPEFSQDASEWEAGWMYEDDKDMGEQHQ